MEIDRLQLRNFRQFREEEVEFAAGPEGSVTVVHGSNGSGKTTLLNAFTWLFYGEVDFDTRPDRLASEGVMATADPGDQVSVEVRLTFDHDGASYEAYRERVYEKRSETDFNGETVDSEVAVRLDDGSGWTRRENPDNTLDQVIPERLSGLFFFDGEDIDELAGIDNQDRIRDSIQNIMGLTILERATRHLDAVTGRFEDEVDEYGSDELSGLISEKQEIETEIDKLKRARDDAERSKERVGTEISDIEQKLGALDDSTQLQEERERLEQEQQAVREEVDELNDSIRTEINDRGTLSLAMPLVRETAKEIDQLRKDGEIPSGLSDEFVDSLLDSGQCLCGRPLEPGTEHYQQLVSLRGDALADGVEQNALRIIGHIQEFSDGDQRLAERVETLIEERGDRHERLQKLDEKIDNISSELKDLDQTTSSGESVADLEAKRQQKREQREELSSEVGQIEQRIDSKEERLETVEAEVDDKQDEREEALLAKRRQRASETVEEQLAETFDNLQDKVRKWCNQTIGDTFDAIASKNLSAEVDEDFKLKIWQDVGDQRVEVDKSTGERQIASLAFIGSLVSIARERYESDSETEYFTGGIYPIVMDSPFGALDKSHRRQVSEVIPTLGNQVVVFATDSQWEGPVEQEMRESVEQQYWLDFDPGEEDGTYPQTRIQSEPTRTGGN